MGGLVLLLACLLVLPGIALAAVRTFPGTNPAESPRANTPNDPDFDPCEGDDEDGPPSCSSYWDEQYRAFGFSPDSANQVPLVPHSVGATQYLDCSQLDQQGKSANMAAGDPQCAQIAGIRADSAWKYWTGDPGTSIAILDTGIRWQERELIDKIHLNAAELPTPQTTGGAACAQDDCNGDGAFNVEDFASDPRVLNDAGDSESDSVLDASDLIATFSDGTDADGNGYVDDIAGWDFFDNDNDPFDASSCCSANGHGTARARDAAAETNNGLGGVGVCPRCQIMPLRVWDTFVVPIDSYAMGTVYAADNGASVVEGAVGGLGNTQFARSAFRYADQKGVALTLVSSDINSANHNYPTNYNEAIYVAGSLPDTAPNNTCTGPGGLPGLPDFIPSPPSEFQQGCQEFLNMLSSGLNITPTAQPITTSFFRNANLTQYGGKADIVLMGSTGSENTSQASGAAGLLASYGKEVFGAANPLSGNEIRQLLTMTAEDVLPANTGSIGQPDKANQGWDPHFGYGRVNLAAAMNRIQAHRIPPEAQIDSPDWFSPIDVDRVGANGVPITGRARAPHGAGVGKWEIEYACGQDALDSSFQPLPGASGTSAVAPGGSLGTISRQLLKTLADTCDGQVSNDAGRPAGTAAEPWPANPYPSPDPERHAFQIRLTVHEAGDAANFGRYRKTLFAYEDDGNHSGWPRPVGAGSEENRYVTGSGGEVSPRLFDLNGDNKLDVILPISSGELYVLNADGTPVQSFNGGDPVHTNRYQLELNHPVPAGLPTPHEALRVPAIGDIDGDLEPEIVATAGEHVYAWNADGSRVDGFPVDIRRALSDPCKPGAPHPCLNAADRAITTSNHIKRGFAGSPALADLIGDGALEIVAGSLDQHLYAWDGTGQLLPHFPVKLATSGADGAEIITSPTIAQLDGKGRPEIVIATNEVAPGKPEFPGSFFEFFSAALSSTTGFNPVYAVHADGSQVSGWPVKVGVAAGDLLPFVLPGHDQSALDVDGDGNDEVSVSAATSVMPGGARLVDGDGTTISSYENGQTNGADQGPVLNLADYSSVGDLLGAGKPAVVKGGMTVNGAANLLAVNQNLPYNHVEQAWDPATGAALPGFPRATDDFQLLSEASIARVAGSGPGRQALVGTGLYQLHAYGTGGLEPAGWPKFTGGWLQVTPAVGDADGDGKLEVAAETREGWSFLWNTGVPACGGSNDEWWTFHHDEQSTANYGADGRPPGTPRNLDATTQGSGATLSWLAPGDDWLCGKAKKLRVLVSSRPIDHPTEGRTVKERAPGGPAGERDSVGLTADDLGGAKYAAVLYQDEAGNWGHLAAVSLAGGGGGGGGGPGGGGPGGGGGLQRGPCANRDVGTTGADRLKGTRAGDRLIGRRGADVLLGRRGADCLRGNGGPDKLRGGRGRDKLLGGIDQDRLFARDGVRDLVSCGRGRHDVAVVDRRDRVRGCEKVRLRRR